MLREAAMEGNTQLLRQIHGRNPLLLDRLIAGCFDETPLHVASLRGHVDFATQLVALNPDLAEALDSRRSTPLHLASAKGNVEIVRALADAKPQMCEALDRDSLNPLHLAAIKGKVGVLRELLVRASPQAARARADHGETILHLCVKNHQLEALKLLIVEGQLQELVNAKDDYGHTILHLAVADKQILTVKYLLESCGVDVNATNANGYTALDILAQSRRGVQDWDIGNSLQEAGAIKAAANGNHSTRPGIMTTVLNVQSTPLPTQEHNNAQIQASCLPANGSNPEMPSFLHDQSSMSSNDINQDEWLAKKRDALMVVASLLATMAFQAGVNPPGGVWQDDSPQIKSPDQPVHRAGEAVIAYNYRETYKFYLRANTISFVASVSTILLLISGLPLKRKTFMWVLSVILWLSITSMAFTYAFSIVAVTPKRDRAELHRTMYVAVPVWCGVMALLLLGHTLRLTARCLNGIGIDMWKPFRRFKFCGTKPCPLQPRC